MYIDDYGNEYETRTQARMAFGEKFDERMADIVEFCEVLSGFSDLTEILEFLCDRDKSILPTPSV